MNLLTPFLLSLVVSLGIGLIVGMERSEDQQKKRIQERLKDPLKKWKYSDDDIKSSKQWKEYTKVYEQILNRCSSEIPWIIVPADNKWYRDHLVASTIVKKLRELNLKYPHKKK